MSNFFILDESGNPVPADLLTWSRWLKADLLNRRVAFDEFDGPTGKVTVSTVFLGLDHGFCPSCTSVPVLWESMTFGLPSGDQPQERYTSKADALAGHAAMLAEARAACAVDEPIIVKEQV